MSRVDRMIAVAFGVGVLAIAGFALGIIGPGNQPGEPAPADEPEPPSDPSGAPERPEPAEPTDDGDGPATTSEDPSVQPPPVDEDDPSDEAVPAGPPPVLEVGLGLKNVEQLDEWIDAVGVTPDVMDLYVAWDAFEAFPEDLADELADRGVTLKLTWEPWVAEGGVDQPTYQLAAIAGGEHDAYLERWAGQIADLDQEVIIRLMHEMNGNWYPWGPGVNGNQSDDFVAAWQHIHTIFDEEGATNVVWEWAPNQLYDGSAALEPLYPGDAYVDRIGISAYNWGDEAAAYHRWREAEELFQPTVAEIRTFTDRPIGIAETASSSVGGDKAAWLESLFTYALDNDYAFLTYFNMETHRDWPVDDEPTYVEAFVEGFERTRASPDRTTDDDT
jgi:mannan endo-1,4-beta-mannosidase